MPDARRDQPRTMMHKKILTEAKANPNASIRDIAEWVSGASPSFVKRVLDEYGDPATSSGRIRRADGAGSAYNQPEGAGHNDPSSSADSEKGSTRRSDSDSKREEDIDVSDLSQKKHETLRAIYEQPTATQEQIASELDVSRATISKRVTEIPGFDWQSRQTFVTEHLDESVQSSTDPVPAGTTDRTDHIDELDDRLDRLEDELESTTQADGTGIDDPVLLQKLVHACLDAEYLSREEELLILRKVLPVDTSD